MASTNYPGSLDAYAVPNNGDTISVADHWLGPAVIGIETELGTDPAGTFTDVKSRLDSGLVTQADMWRLTASKTVDGDLAANLERADTGSPGLLGTGMTESSGFFSFPETGIYLVTVQAYIFVSAIPDNVILRTQVTTNNSSYSVQADAVGHAAGGAGDSNGFSQLLVDVTDVANVKVKFTAGSIGSSSNGIYGNTSYNSTSFSFIRLGGT